MEIPQGIFGALYCGVTCIPFIARAEKPGGMQSKYNSAVGARDLLYLSALLTILIPVFDLLLVGQSIWKNAFTEHWPLLIVDLLALMGALTFWKMGRRVAIRAETGDPNSVWADVVVENQEKKNSKNLAGSVFEKVS